MLVFLQTLEGWVYKDPIHGPLDGPLYMGSIYSNTNHVILPPLHSGDPVHYQLLTSTITIENTLQISFFYQKHWQNGQLTYLH